MMNDIKVSEAERRQIVAWSSEDVSQVEIARRLGRDRNTIGRQQKRLGCKPYRHPLDAEARAKILDLHAEGLSSRRIATRTGLGPRTVTKALREAGMEIKARRPVPREKVEAIDRDIRSRKKFLCQIAKEHGVSLRKVRERKMQILGPAPLLSVWPPLQTKFSQADAGDYVPSPEEVFLALVRKCIDSIADKYLRQGRDRDAVLAAKRVLKSDPQPILDVFDAGLREAIAAWRLEQMTAGDTVH